MNRRSLRLRVAVVTLSAVLGAGGVAYQVGAFSWRGGSEIPPVGKVAPSDKASSEESPHDPKADDKQPTIIHGTKTGVVTNPQLSE